MINSNAQKRQRKSKENRLNEFIDCAKKIFIAKGYNATTIRDIAREAGCSDGLMFRYFKSKADLFIAIINEGKIRNEVTIEECFSFRLSKEDQIYKIMEVYINKFKDYEQLIRMMFSRALNDPSFEETKTLFKDTTFLKKQIEHFKERQKINDISNNSDCEALALLIYSVTFSIGFNRQSLLGYSKEECLNLAKRYSKIISHGI
ncbi:TetR/AcrR family transcriptional regulator [Silvanigrella paludirubra]|uniref:TetR/AcrR family transcriptional regulator n=1 Tax=Silvanigrella paludirubra TaxID=2499159 RepID=UPI001386EDE5|nr:TetR/AcrR family transcriptional regulator [Silvanigrella paludirubra]